jgi:hypothetical protein
LISLSVTTPLLGHCFGAALMLLRYYSATALLLLVAARRGSFHELFGANPAVFEGISL